MGRGDNKKEGKTYIFMVDKYRPIGVAFRINRGLEISNATSKTSSCVTRQSFTVIH